MTQLDTELEIVVIVHDVADYDTWKRAFDAAATIRAFAGERTYQVLRDTHTPNRIVHWSAWTSHDAARAFFESPEVAAIRRDAGVEDPLFLYLRSTDAGTLSTPGDDT